MTLIIAFGDVNMAKIRSNNLRVIPHKFDPEEGTYYERVFSPEKVKVEKIDKIVQLTLTDRQGYKLVVVGGRLVRIVCRLLRPWTPFTKASEVYGLRETPSKLESVLQRALIKSKRGFKAMFDDKGNLVGVASEIHKQISWKEVRGLVEGAIKKTFGIVTVPEGSSAHPNKWTYRMPVKDDWMSAWVTVSAGNNIVKGKSGIRVWSRFRTDKGRFKRPACLNWCGMWEVPLNFFGVKTERLGEIQGIELLNMQQFHLANAIQNEAEFQQQLINKMEGMKKVIKKGILPIIKQSRRIEISKSEMEGILEAYQGKLALPKYIVKQILKHVEEETVWGFSQAVSWVRTHGEFDEKRSKLPREERRLTQNLENIAGEVLSIAPTIEKLHKVLGKRKITARVLVNPEKMRGLKRMVAK